MSVVQGISAIGSPLHPAVMGRRMIGETERNLVVACCRDDTCSHLNYPEVG